jgi:integrase
MQANPSTRRKRVATGIYFESGSYVAGYTHPLTRSWTTAVLSGARNKTEAVKARRALIEGLASGRVAAPSTITVADFAQEWLSTREGRVKPRTYEADERNVSIIRKHFGSLRVQALGARQVEQFLAKLRSGVVTGNSLSERSVGQAFGTLRLICASARSDDLLVTNPCDRVQRHARPKQKSTREPRVLSNEQVVALVDAARRKTPAYAGVIAVLGYTGSRAREALGLRWGDVDTTAKLVTFGHQIDKAGTELVELKTESAQRVNALTPALEGFLGKEARMKARWSADGDFVFSARQGKPVEYRNLRRALDAAAEEAGLGHVRPHDLRHSATSILLQHVDLGTVSRYVGHANVAVTARVYSHAIGSPTEQAARVAAAMRAGGFGY